MVGKIYKACWSKLKIDLKIISGMPKERIGENIGDIRAMTTMSNEELISILKETCWGTR